MIWYDITWYDMIWFGIWYPTTGHDCLGKLLSRSGRSGVLLFSLLRKRFLCSVFPCAPYLSWEACSVQTYLVRMCCKNIQQEHALHTFCQVFLKQCRAWPWSQSSWHRVDIELTVYGIARFGAASMFLAGRRRRDFAATKPRNLHTPHKRYKRYKVTT
jgi:hypothetical protein